jgi:hypothetical protein
VLWLDWRQSSLWRRGVEGSVHELSQIFLRRKDFRIDFFEQCKVSHKLLGQSRYGIGEVGDRGKDLDAFVFQTVADRPKRPGTGD